MPTNYVDAEDTILGMLKTAWDANAPAVVGSVYTPSLVFEQLEADLKPHPRDGDKAWARVSIRNGDSEKASLRNSAGLARYRRMGIAWIQVFTHSKFANSWTQASQLASVAQRAYEGKAGAVVFTKVSVQDMPLDGNWVRKDVKAFFYWDEIH